MAYAYSDYFNQGHDLVYHIVCVDKDQHVKGMRYDELSGFVKCQIQGCEKCLSDDECERCEQPLENGPDLFLLEGEDEDADQCLPCSNNPSLFLDSEGNCQRCSEKIDRCLECDSSSVCNKCRDGFYFHQDQSLCLSSCPEGFGIDESTLSCQSCQSDFCKE